MRTIERSPSAQERRNARRLALASHIFSTEETRREIEAWAIDTGMTLREAHADLLEMNS